MQAFRPLARHPANEYSAASVQFCQPRTRPVPDLPPN
ncbi:MAG: hypothetical protein JWO69_788, partial [Thermoleophilia bacterium]|nr:hypothetical protein [Thermoleophilia bacterium]